MLVHHDNLGLNTSRVMQIDNVNKRQEETSQKSIHIDDNSLDRTFHLSFTSNCVKLYSIHGT